MHFLSLPERDAVLSIDNNGSHLSSAYMPGVVLSTLPAPFEVLCDNTFYPLCFDIIFSFTKKTLLQLLM